MNREEFKRSFDDLMILGFTLIDEEGNYIDPIEYYNVSWEDEDE